MRFATVNSRDLAPGPDNPTGRWTPAYHVLLAMLRESAAYTPGQFAELYDHFRKLAKAYGTRMSDFDARVAQATNEQDMYALVLKALGLTEPSAEVSAGLHRLAAFMIEDEAKALELRIALDQDRLRKLRG